MRRVSGATGAAREELLLAQTLVGFLTFKIFHMYKNQKKSVLGLHFDILCKQTSDQLLCAVGFKQEYTVIFRCFPYRQQEEAEAVS